MRTRQIDPKTVDLEFLKEEFNRFRSELGGMKDRLGANAADALDQMGAYLNGSGVSSRLSALESELDALAGKLKGTGKVAVNRLETEVSNKPLVSIALAFGAGLLVSQLIRRG
jgi:ElaB/YqjD/DUF883 family membrane-anchored ribosome-binding protein